MDPMTLFGIQFTLSLTAWLLIGFWFVTPRLRELPRAKALAPLVWVQVGRIVGGTILAPGAVDLGVPTDFRLMIGYGDMITAVLALLTLVALRASFRTASVLVWLLMVVATADTANAIVQSMKDHVFGYALGVNWVIVTLYVPALLVSSLLIVIRLLTPDHAPARR
jgi:hypothetical protein